MEQPPIAIKTAASVDAEKGSQAHAGDYKDLADTVTVPVVSNNASIEKGSVASSDGDDALKLAGTQAHYFDEKYYLRLRHKVVCHIYPLSTCKSV